MNSSTDAPRRLPPKKLTLDEFFRAARNTLFREAMFRHQLLHDIYTTCAHMRKSVHLYEPEIDVSGFDLVVDNLLSTLRFQLKSKMSTSRTSSWDIHKILLRPNVRELNSLPFVPDSSGHGYMGGVILITATIADEKITYRYSYTDALVICAMNMGIAAPKHPISRQSVTATFKELTRPDFEPGQMKIPQAAFWKFSSLEKLLQFAGFHENSMLPVRFNLHRAISQWYLKECRDPLTPNRDRSAAMANQMVEEMLGLPLTVWPVPIPEEDSAVEEHE